MSHSYSISDWWKARVYSLRYSTKAKNVIESPMSLNFILQEPYMFVQNFNLSHSCWDILVWTKVVDQQTNICIPRAMLLAWLKRELVEQKDFSSIKGMKWRQDMGSFGDRPLLKFTCFNYGRLWFGSRTWKYKNHKGRVLAAEQRSTLTSHNYFGQMALCKLELQSVLPLGSWQIQSLYTSQCRSFQCRP